MDFVSKFSKYIISLQFKSAQDSKTKKECQNDFKIHVQQGECL